MNKHLQVQLHRFLEFWKVDDLITVLFFYLWLIAFPDGSDGKESAGNAGDPGSIPESGRSPGEGNGNPLQDSCLENSMDKGAWWATVHGVTKSWTWLSNTFTFKGYRWMARWRGTKGRVQKNPKHTCICPCEVRVSYLPSILEVLWTLYFWDFYGDFII